MTYYSAFVLLRGYVFDFLMIATVLLEVIMSLCCVVSIHYHYLAAKCLIAMSDLGRKDSSHYPESYSRL